MPNKKIQPGLPRFQILRWKKKIRYMNQPPRLPFDRRLNRRMIVAQRVDSNPTQKIEIALALGIPKIYASPPNKKNRLAFVGRKQKLRFHARNRSKTHALSTSVPHSILVK